MRAKASEIGGSHLSAAAAAAAVDDVDRCSNSRRRLSVGTKWPYGQYASKGHGAAPEPRGLLRAAGCRGGHDEVLRLAGAVSTKLQCQDL